MSENVELSSLNLRYEGYRLRDDATEARVLASIVERGIEEPLEGVDTPEHRFLLNGFKRCRSARKLGMATIPYVSLAEEEASGILMLMRLAPSKSLQILEQAKFVVELMNMHGMSIGDVAESLSRSKGWVCMRRNLLDHMSEATERILFRGTFPVYSYMYTLRPFMRMNSVTPQDLDRFIEVVAGKRLSVRDSYRSRFVRVPFSRLGRPCEWKMCGRSADFWRLRIRECNGSHSEPVAEVEGGRTEGKTASGYPEIKLIAFAVTMKALKDVACYVHRELGA